MCNEDHSRLYTCHDGKLPGGFMIFDGYIVTRIVEIQKKKKLKNNIIFKKFPIPHSSDRKKK
jgi:hypothetical protein